MSTRLHIVVSVGLRDRIDAALGPGQSRGDFVRRAVERALGDEGRFATGGSSSPAPAEQPEKWEGFPVRSDERVPRGRVAAASPREFRPYPKGGG